MIYKVMVKRKLLALISVIALTVIISSCNAKTAVDYANKGEDSLRTRNYDEAIKNFTIAINKGELSTKYLAITYKYRAYAFNEKRQFDAAIEDLNKAIELDPNYYAAYSDRGVALAEKNQHDRALSDFNKAIELNPQYYMPYYYKSCFYALKNDSSESCKWLHAAIEKGYNDWGSIKNDSCLDSIRKSTCYMALMSGR